MIIAVDLDDTLSDYLTSFIEFHNEKYGTSIKFEDFTAYTLNEITGMPREEEIKRIEEFDNSSYYDNIKPIKEGVKAIEKLSKKHKIAIVTSRPEKYEKKTREWLKKNLPMIKDLFFMRKMYHGNVKTKAEICKEIGANVLIDDSLEHISGCEKADINFILIDYPWNKDDKLSKLVRRVKSWSEVIVAVDELEKQLNSGGEIK